MTSQSNEGAAPAAPSDVLVRDWKGIAIQSGSAVVFGSPETPEETAKATGTVIAIGDPDVLYNPVTDTDDGGYALNLTVRFPDGTEETVAANIVGAESDEGHEVFEASDDIEVIA